MGEQPLQVHLEAAHIAALEARVAELKRDRDRARNLVQTYQELAADVEVERDRAKARVAQLERERDEARARIADMEANTHTYCAYCGHKEEIDPDGTAIAQHIAQCKKHPMRRVERERDTAREIVEKMEAERYVTLQRLDELVRALSEARMEREFQRERAQVNVDLREKARARIAELERERDQLRNALEGLMEWCRCDCVGNEGTCRYCVADKAAALGKEAT